MVESRLPEAFEFGLAVTVDTLFLQIYLTRELRIPLPELLNPLPAVLAVII